MARPLEECFICGQSPCVCGKPAKKKAVVKKPQPSKVAPPVAPPVEKPRFKKIGTTAPPKAQSRFDGKVQKHRERDLSAENALRVLRDLVCDKDRARIDQALKLEYSQDVDRRLSEWKEAHGET